MLDLSTKSVIYYQKMATFCLLFAVRHDSGLSGCWLSADFRWKSSSAAFCQLEDVWSATLETDVSWLRPKTVKPNILSSCTIYEAPPTGWNRSSHGHLATRRLESGVGCILKYWLRKIINSIVRQRLLKLCLLFQRCAAMIVRHVYAFYLTATRASRLLHHFSLQMGGASYILIYSYIHTSSSQPILPLSALTNVPWFCLHRLWRYINCLLTYLLIVTVIKYIWWNSLPVYLRQNNINLELSKQLLMAFCSGVKLQCVCLTVKLHVEILLLMYLLTYIIFSVMYWLLVLIFIV